MADIIDGITDVTSVVGNVFDLLTSNPLLVFFLAAGLVGVGITLFTQLRGAAH